MTADKTAQPPRKPRRAAENPDVRAALLDAAEALVREQGYAAATARRIAGRVGLKHQVVFYYFGSQEDLLLALFRRSAASHRERLTKAMESDRPIRAMWELASDPDVTRFTLEFLALANHNDAIRAEIAKDAEAVRKLETEAVARHLEARGIQPLLSPQFVTILTNALARLLVQESTLGITLGHDEAEALVEGSLRQFEISGYTSAGLEPLLNVSNSPG